MLAAERAKSQGGHSGGSDDHLVPREDMEKLYRYDDRDELERQHGWRVVVINNEREGAEFLEQQADEVLELIRSWPQSV